MSELKQNYRAVKCLSLKTGKFAGYLGTWNANVILVQDPTNEATAFCRWHRDGGKLYLAKHTSPQDRWLGVGNGCADWGVTWYEPVVLNENNTVTLLNDSKKALFGNPGSKDYVEWQSDSTTLEELQILLPHPARWLKDIANTTLIGDINLPGTHDSAAIAGNIVGSVVGSPWACHTSSITEQLDYGVRLLDVRIKITQVSQPQGQNPGTYTFGTCHGDFNLGISAAEYQSLQSLMEECAAFLTKNQSEFIAMSIKVDDWNNVPDQHKLDALSVLQKFLTPYPLARSDENLPKLQDVRKHIYLLDRITPALPSAIQPPPHQYKFGPPIGIPDNTEGVNLQPASGARSFPVYVQDKYQDLAFLNPGSEKLKLFVKALSQKPAGGILLNFASATQKVLFGVYIQEDVAKYIDDNRPAKLGWSLFDYQFKDADGLKYGKANCVELIISSNFDYDR
jgi:hypothetical protein